MCPEIPSDAVNLARVLHFQSFAGTRSASPSPPLRGALKLTDSAERAQRPHLPAHAGRPRAGPSLSHLRARERGPRLPEGQIPGPRVLGRRVKIIKGAVESERGEGWREGDGCRSSPPPARLYPLAAADDGGEAWGEELGRDAPQISLPLRALTRARPLRPKLLR